MVSSPVSAAQVREITLGIAGNNGTGSKKQQNLRANCASLSPDDKLHFRVISGKFEKWTIHARYKNGWWASLYEGKANNLPVSQLTDATRKHQYTKRFGAPNQYVFTVNGAHTKFSKTPCKIKISKLCPVKVEKPRVPKSPPPKGGWRNFIENFSGNAFNTSRWNAGNIDKCRSSRGGNFGEWSIKGGHLNFTRFSDAYKPGFTIATHPFNKQSGIQGFNGDWVASILIRDFHFSGKGEAELMMKMIRNGGGLNVGVGIRMSNRTGRKLVNEVKIRLYSSRSNLNKAVYKTLPPNTRSVVLSIIKQGDEICFLINSKLAKKWKVNLAKRNFFWLALANSTTPGASTKAKIDWIKVVSPGGPEPDVLRSREEPNPPPVLLPKKEVTRKIIRFRRQADDLVRKLFPKMTKKLYLERKAKFNKTEFYVRVFQQLFTIVYKGREFQYRSRLVFYFNPRGKVYYFYLPVIQPKQKLPPEPPLKPRPKKKLKLPPLKHRTAAGCMVLTNLAKLKSKHPDNYPQIRKFLESFGKIIDLGAARIRPGDWRAADRWLEKHFDRKKCSSLFIFGNNDVVPYGVYSNPTYGIGKKGSEDPDKTILSDDYYADFDHDPKQDWEIMVTRLPDDPGILESPESVIYLPERERTASVKRKFVVYGNAKWIMGTKDMAGTDSRQNREIKWSEPTTERNFSDDFFKGRNVFINLHGLDRVTTVYWGEKPDTPNKVCVNAMNISHANARGAIIMAACCYGAYTPGKNSDSSIALRFLRNGAVCYIGNTRVGYIDLKIKGCGRNYILLWTKLFKDLLKKTGSPQQAFMLAKREFAQKMRPDDPYQYKMYHQMIYLGLPPVKTVVEKTAKQPVKSRPAEKNIVDKKPVSVPKKSPGQSVENLCAKSKSYLLKYLNSKRKSRKDALIAMKLAQDAWKLDNNAWQPHLLMGKIYLALNDRDEAVDAAERVHKLAPMQPEVIAFCKDMGIKIKEKAKKPGTIRRPEKKVAKTSSTSDSKKVSETKSKTSGNKIRKSGKLRDIRKLYEKYKPYVIGIVIIILLLGLVFVFIVLYLVMKSIFEKLLGGGKVK